MSCPECNDTGWVIVVDEVSTAYCDGKLQQAVTSHAEPCERCALGRANKRLILTSRNGADNADRLLGQ